MTESARPSEACRLWWRLEPIHAVTYFSPEARAATEDVGLRGFWRGYFGTRAAALGPAPAGLVTATFFNFRPSMVERAVPEVWTLATPEEALRARLDGAVATLRRVVDDHGLALDPLAEAAALAEAAVADLPADGRPLFGALTSVARPSDPLGRLWHAATLLREHRGDGHVAATLADGIDGLGAHVLFVAVGPITRARLQGARGWTDQEWDASVAALAGRGLVDDEGRATEAGRALRAGIEARTDELAAGPVERLGTDDAERLRTLVTPLARAIVADGVVPAVSPVGDLGGDDA
ncbi:MAG: hypothetical protein KF906_05850 [Actinobacteria bacterium]|nr:hypothetical protein [Actinomycetota bacterium]